MKPGTAHHLHKCKVWGRDGGFIKGEEKLNNIKNWVSEKAWWEPGPAQNLELARWFVLQQDNDPKHNARVKTLSMSLSGQASAWTQRFVFGFVMMVYGV